MVKKVIFMILMLMIVACSQQQFVCPDGSVADSVANCPQEELMEEEVVEQAPPAPPAPTQEEVEEELGTIGQGVQDLIAKADKIKSFEFVYVGPPENLPMDTYLVKGDGVVVKLGKATDHKLSQDFTHVYISGNSAVAYCNVKDMTWCPEGIKRHGKVEGEDYLVKTPYQWMKSIKSGEVIGNGPSWEKRSTTKIEFVSDDSSGEMYVIDFYGLPGKIMLDNGDVIEFRDLSTNSVSDEEMKPPVLN